MLLYFEFEDKRRKANVSWPKSGGNIIVHVTDSELVKRFPSDFYFEVNIANKVVFTAEDVADKRLLELQHTIAKKLQELTFS